MAPPVVFVPVVVARTNPQAVASFVLSLLWLGGLGALLAVIFGIAALRSINRSHGQERGTGFAVAGLVIGGVGTLFAVVLYIAIVGLAHQGGTG
jgi:hypothetical protein